MKRHPALVPLSHDHQHTLVEARRLRRAAAGAEHEAAADAFLRYFSSEIVRHFRVEEELLFPLVEACAEARELVVRALLDHQHLHALARRLQESLANLDESGLMRELADALERHVRLEERELFPLIESVGADRLHRLELAPDDGDASIVDLLRPLGRGPAWGTESEDLNATLLLWPPGHTVAKHVNSDRDVLLIVLDGSAVVTMGDRESGLGAGDALVIAKGRPRQIVAGPAGVRYLTVHTRRGPLQIASRLRA